METRVDQWKRKLLDLSLRNPLLNARDGAKFLPFDGGAPYGGEATTTEVVPYTPPKVGDSVPFSTSLSEKEIRKRLKELYLASRSLYNETGVNSLYVAVGFLSWREKESDEFHQAPLLLIPAQLIRQTASPGYKLKRTDEDAAVNFCLQELLRSQFGIPIKDVAGGGFGDGDPDFNAVFRCFADAIQNKKDWSISTGIALGIFSFSKVVIWKDLSDHFDEFRRNPFVAHLAEGTGLYDDGVKVFPPAEVERHINPDRLFCPMSADSSQMTAVLYSELGKSFVLHGPPGTGKSQTITNIIADNLAKGKRVLFVSEKKAALDVVYKRLASVGLAPFCLELHSNKADKANVMRQFAEAIDVKPSRPPAHWQATCSNLSTGVVDLNRYASELHTPCANGMTAFDCLSRHGAKHPQADASLISLNVADMTHESLRELGDVIRGIADEWRGVDKSDYAALEPVLTNDWSPDFEEQVRVHADAFLKALSERQIFKRFLKLIWCAPVSGFKGTFLYPFGTMSFDEQREKMQAVLNHLGGLRLVLSYRLKRRKANKAKCGKFIEALEKGLFSCDEAVRVFEDSCSEKTLNTLISRSKTLSGFSGVKHEERIARFRELDAEYMASVKKMIVAILSKRRDEIEHPPMVRDKDGNTMVLMMDPELERQLAVLKRECEKKKRFMPPRKLLSETKDLAMRLKPCFLMSPLSVAQYLPVAGDLFDMVVFDEASQMTVWDAVGVIARGKQLIVVGDPKQLPPTNFFVKGDVKDEDREDDPATEDLESVLDECLANGLYSAYLNWHYRSRHESLIAFSNRHYYDDRLNTFPAPETGKRFGMSFHYVDGALYDHVSHTNRDEAAALVDRLFERLSNAAERKRSWGIVTFSVAQQKLIEDLVEKKSSEFDWATDFFDDSKPDAFFVKNLENVQGDERDVIIFSIAYAPDAQGRFAMSFGPINRPGGERRLNVAITRAREQVVVFASVHASSIHAERTNSVGVKHLKALMEFAETGHLEGDSAKTSEPLENGIVGEIRGFLEKSGYAVEERFGRSSMPIDLAVKDPKDENRYALAIELDGPCYAAQKTVRDRDVLRNDVLSHLGWKYFRMWSIDWAYDRKRTERRLLEALPKVERLQPDNQPNGKHDRLAGSK